MVEGGGITPRSSVSDLAGKADCGCVYHAVDGTPCEHDLALVLTSEKDYSKCPASPDGQGRHVADPRSAQQADGVDFVVDYFCKNCGQSGGLVVAEADIDWG